MFQNSNIELCFLFIFLEKPHYLSWKKKSPSSNFMDTSKRQKGTKLYEGAKQWSHKVTECEGGHGNSAPYDTTKAADWLVLSITF